MYIFGFGLVLKIYRYYNQWCAIINVTVKVWVEFFSESVADEWVDVRPQCNKRKPALPRNPQTPQPSSASVGRGTQRKQCPVNRLWWPICPSPPLVPQSEISLRDVLPFAITNDPNNPVNILGLKGLFCNLPSLTSLPSSESVRERYALSRSRVTSEA